MEVQICMAYTTTIHIPLAYQSTEMVSNQKFYALYAENQNGIRLRKNQIKFHPAGSTYIVAMRLSAVTNKKYREPYVYFHCRLQGLRMKQVISDCMSGRLKVQSMKMCYDALCRMYDLSITYTGSSGHVSPYKLVGCKAVKAIPKIEMGVIL